MWLQPECVIVWGGYRVRWQPLGVYRHVVMGVDLEGPQGHQGSYYNLPYLKCSVVSVRLDSTEWRVIHIILDLGGDQVQVKNFCMSCFYGLSTLLILQRGGELRGHVLLWKLITLSVCKLAALDCRMVSSPWLTILSLQWSWLCCWEWKLATCFFKLFSGGLLFWECARNRDGFSEWRFLMSVDSTLAIVWLCLIARVIIFFCCDNWKTFGSMKLGKHLPVRKRYSVRN